MNAPELKCKVWRDHDNALRLRVAGKAKAPLVRDGATVNPDGTGSPVPQQNLLCEHLPAEGLVRGEELTITLPRALVLHLLGGPEPRKPREGRPAPDEVTDWLDLAKRIHKAVTDQATGEEIVDQVLRPCGMVKNRHPEVLAWAAECARKGE